MFEKLRESWRELKASKPGERFQDHFERRRRNRSSMVVRVAWIALGTVIIALGLVMMVAPGPGILGLFVGGGLIAQEARFMARFLDWSEVKLRAIVEALLGFWRRAPMALRVAVVLVVLSVAAGAGYGAWLIAFG